MPENSTLLKNAATLAAVSCAAPAPGSAGGSAMTGDAIIIATPTLAAPSTRASREHELESLNPFIKIGLLAREGSARHDAVVPIALTTAGWWLIGARAAPIGRVGTAAP